jgi:hypothetical protein
MVESKCENDGQAGNEQLYARHRTEPSLPPFLPFPE